MRRFLALLPLALIAAPLAADTVVTEKRVRDAFTYGDKEQPKLEQTVTTWFGDGQLRRDEGTTSFLLSAKANTLTILDHEAKTASVLQLPIDMEQYVPEAMRPQLRQFRDAMKIESTITPSGTTEKVGNWEAERVDITLSAAAMGMKTELTMWIAKGFEVDRELFALAARTMAALQPAAGEFAEKLIALGGYPVRTTTKMSGMGTETTTREEVVSLETKEAPAGWYQIPEGYSNKPFNPLEGAGLGR